MIMPRKIIFFTGCLIPLGLAMPYLPVLWNAALCGIGVLVVLAFIDIFQAVRTGRGIKIDVQLLTRCSQHQEGNIIYKFENRLPAAVKIDSFYPCMAEEFHCEAQINTLELMPNKSSGLAVKFQPEYRGSFGCPDCIAEIKSPWGLWTLRKKVKLDGEIQVYPDTITEQKKLAALFLNHGMSGMHLNRLTGQGREFERLRDYVPGDSYDIISWKATARKGKPVSKVFQVENTQSIYAVIDSSRFSMIEKDGRTNLDHYLASALVLGAIAQKQKDKFGIIVFDSKIRSFVPAMSNAAAAKTCRNAVYKIKPQCVSPDYNNLFSFIRARVPRRSLLFFLTDLSDALPAEEFQRDIKLLSRKHLCCVDMALHDKVKPLFSEKVQTIEDLYTSLAGQIKWADLVNIKRSLSKRGVQLNTSGVDSLSLNLVNTYLNIKRKQIL